MFFTIITFTVRENKNIKIFRKFHKTKEEKEEYLKHVYVQYIDSYAQNKFETYEDLMYWCDNTMSTTTDEKSMTRIIDQYYHVLRKHDVIMSIEEYEEELNNN